METNIIVILKCQSKNGGQDYYHNDKTYDLSIVKPLIDEYRNKILELNPEKYETPEWYKDMDTHETYLVSKDHYLTLRHLRHALHFNENNISRSWYDALVEIEINGLNDWVKNGEIELGDSVICTDPCYSIDTWCTVKTDNVLPGKYSCFYQREINENRIATIKVMHNDYVNLDPTELIDGEVGVDSGQAGVFDFEYYESQRETNEDAFYDCCCNVTYNEHKEMNASYKPLESFIDEKMEEYKDELAKYDSESEEYKKIRSSLVSHPAIQAFYEYKKTHPNCDERYIRHGEMAANLVSDGLNKGYVSSSGYGDGGYDCYVARNEKNQIVGFKIVFIGFSEDPYNDENEE